MKVDGRPLLVLLLPCVVLVSANAQSIDRAELRARVDSLSAAGEFASVVALLEPHVQLQAEGAEIWMLLATHQYWNKDIAGARRTYKAALRHHSDHRGLRIASARFLLENGEPDTAKEVLRPLGRDAADAEAIRGTIAWWSGDLTAASRHFKRALAAKPDHAEATSALASIRAEARPWMRLAGQGGTDNQPLDQGGASIETGFFVTPLQTLRADVKRTLYAAGDVVTPITFASAASTGFWPAARLETDLEIGLTSRPDSASWTGRIAAGLRLPYGLRAGARWERLPYLYTEASIFETITTSAVQADISADRAGWLGEAVVRRERFPDDNTKDVIYGWLLAPLFRTNALTVQAGYAYGYQNAAENRFSPVITGSPRPGQAPAWEGRYTPYYTPLNMQTHSLPASIALQASRDLTVRANGVYAFAGSEDAPFVYVVNRAPLTGVYDHKIHPWNLRGSIEAAVTPNVTLHVEGSHMATTWYRANSLQLSIYARL